MSKPKRKLSRRERDLEAGMIFAWRVPGGSLGRLVFGVLVASGLFAGAASMIRVKAPERREQARESARVVVLRADDSASRELIDWARIQSPFPDRWEPAPDGRLADEMTEVMAYLVAQSAYEARLRPRLVEPRRPGLPGMIGDVPEVSMTLEGAGTGASPEAVALPVKANSVAMDGLAGRWGRRSAEWERDNAAELMGSEARFMLGVTPGGVVEVCLLMDKSKSLSKEAEVEMERWIRGQKLEPDPEAADTAWGLVRIRLEPVVVEGRRDD